MVRGKTGMKLEADGATDFSVVFPFVQCVNAFHSLAFPVPLPQI
jgi:hypothetical protein